MIRDRPGLLWRANFAWRVRWRRWLAGSCLLWAVLIPSVIFVGLRHRGHATSLPEAVLLGAMAVALLAAAMFLAVAEQDDKRRQSEYLLREYMEELRQYAVENIETMRGTLDTLAEVRPPLPPAEVPVTLEDAGKELRTRERDTLLRIIYGMARAAPYSYDPTAQRSDTVPTIASATAAAHCSVDADTVRKYLREAANKFGRASGAGR